MKIFCPLCKKEHEIKGYNKDNPVLECGHVKEQVVDSQIGDIDQVIDNNAKDLVLFASLEGGELSEVVLQKICDQLNS